MSEDVTAAPTRTGPAALLLFHRAYALVALCAWVSLAVQVRVLVGARGLLPAAPFFEALRARGVAFLDAPSVFWLGASDAALVAGALVGAALSALALAGVRPRACIALTLPLYLSYCTAGRAFFGFQWDLLLIETGLVVLVTPTTRASPLGALLVRALLFKLYVESGVAKWQSHLGDWQDGSAMLHYYETAPLPGPAAWLAHSLPAWWHHFESRAVLALELVVPFALFAPRRPRYLALALLTAFQLANLATANYGFFIPLTLALHAGLLDDADVLRLGAWARPRLDERPPRFAGLRRAGLAGFAAAWLALSALEADDAFASGRFAAAAPTALTLAETLRAVNAYHLFGHITRERIEPEVETLEGGAWTERPLRFKPGDVRRTPPLAWPHQPRVDFQLWFHGLEFERGMPPYVARLLERLCAAPDAVQPLFPGPLPARPDAARLVYWRYRFTTPDERRATGDVWSRERVAEGRATLCR